jgi:hypothetical protein
VSGALNMSCGSLRGGRPWPVTPLGTAWIGKDGAAVVA